MNRRLATLSEKEMRLHLISTVKLCYLSLDIFNRWRLRQDPAQRRLALSRHLRIDRVCNDFEDNVEQSIHIIKVHAGF